MDGTFSYLKIQTWTVGGEHDFWLVPPFSKESHKVLDAEGEEGG